MTIKDKNDNDILRTHIVKYPLNNAESEFHYGRILEIIEKNDGTKVLCVEPLREIVQVVSTACTRMAKYHDTVASADLKKHAVDHEEIDPYYD